MVQVTQRQRGIIIDRSGGRPWITSSGASVIPTDEWDLTALVAAAPERVPEGVRIVVSDFDEPSLRHAVAQQAQAEPVHRLSTTSEHFLGLAAQLREDHGIAGNGVSYTTRLRNKWSMKQRALAHGIRTLPGTRADELTPWLDTVTADHGFVLKPLEESGSVGVQLLGDKSELRRAVRGLDEPSRHLVEVRSPHPVLHVDVVVTARDLVMEVSQYERPCHESGRGTPLSSFTVDDAQLRREAEQAVRAIVQAWEIHADVLHIEFFADPAGLVLLELAGRPGAAGVSAVFSHTRGSDLLHAKTRLDFGIDPLRFRSTPIARHGGWTVLYAPTNEPADVDDTAVKGHATRDVLDPGARRVDGVAGLGVATYTFAEDSVAAVRERIRTYEEQVVVSPARSVGAPGGA